MVVQKKKLVLKKIYIEAYYKNIFQSDSDSESDDVFSVIIIVTSKSSLPDDLSFDDIVFVRYASITSTDVERNFSSYANNNLLAGIFI